MPNLDDMRIAAKSLRRLAELMEADVRKEEGVETKYRTREEVNALGGLVAELEYLNGEIASLKDWRDRPQRYTDMLEDFRRRRDELVKEIKRRRGEK